jgi:hypothetical protein
MVLARGSTIHDPYIGATYTHADGSALTMGEDRAAGATLTMDLSAVPIRTPIAIELQSPGSFEINADGSVTVLDDAGTAVGGFTRPTRGARFTGVDETHVELTRPNDPGVRGEVSTHLGTAAIASTDWGEREGGRSVAVEPTAWTRDAGQAGAATAWAQLVDAEPEADSPGMYDQLVCHAIGAPDKARWNLEPWRPDVGLVAVMAARCNPEE